MIKLSLKEKQLNNIDFNTINYKVTLFDIKGNILKSTNKDFNKIATKILEFHKKNNILPYNKGDVTKINYLNHEILKKSSNEATFKIINPTNITHDNFEKFNMTIYKILNNIPYTNRSPKIDNTSAIDKKEEKPKGSSLFVTGRNYQSCNACTVISGVMVSEMLNKTIKTKDDINIDNCLVLGENRYQEIIRAKKDKYEKQLNEKMTSLNTEKNKYENYLTEKNKIANNIKDYENILNILKKDKSIDQKSLSNYEQLITEYKYISKRKTDPYLSPDEIIENDKFTINENTIYLHTLSHVELKTKKTDNIKQKIEEKLKEIASESTANSKTCGILTTGKGSIKSGFSYALGISKNADNQISNIEFTDSHKTVYNKAFFVRFETLSDFMEFFINKVGHKCTSKSEETYFSFEKFDKNPIDIT